MDDSDLIACIYPVVQPENDHAIAAIEGSSRCVPPRLPNSKQQVQYDPHERESTASPEGSEPVPNYFYLPCVELRFSNIPRTKHGLLFGRDSKSDVVLPHQQISFHHFTLTFDKARRLVVKDWGSSCGVEVTYNDEGHGRRRDFQWIVGGHEVPRQRKTIIINLRETIKFQVVVNHHDIASQAYIDNVNLFCEGMSTAPELFDDLDLPLPPDTELPTGTQTPGTGEIHLRKALGSGSFGVVTHLWNVRNGVEYALKEPLKDYFEEDWKKEARIMKQVSHDHIVKLLSSSFSPHPRLHLEYAPMGSLAHQDHLSGEEGLSILHQCLSALKYLHNERNPPIAHRDIKPDNILIFHRFPGRLHVKLGDFGLSKDSEYYDTFCGTPLYTAPEINKNKPSTDRQKTAYTVGVDIWSLGVVMYELLCGLPPYKKSYGDSETAWAEVVLEKFRADFRKRPDDLRQFLLDAMVVVDWTSRWSSRECLDRVLLLPSVAEHADSPRTSARSNGSGKTIVRYCHARGVGGGQQPLPRLPISSDLPRSPGGCPRSGAPPPGARASRKRGAASLASAPKRREHSDGVGYAGGDEEAVEVAVILQAMGQRRPR